MKRESLWLPLYLLEKIMNYNMEQQKIIAAVDAAQCAELCAAYNEQFGESLTLIGEFIGDWQGVRVAGAVPEGFGFDHFRR